MASHKEKKSFINFMKFSWSGAVTATSAVIILPAVPDMTVVWFNIASYFQQRYVTEGYSPKRKLNSRRACYDQSTTTHRRTSYLATQRDRSSTSSVKSVLPRYDIVGEDDGTPPIYEECAPIAPPPSYQSLICPRGQQSSKVWSQRNQSSNKIMER